MKIFGLALFILSSQMLLCQSRSVFQYLGASDRNNVVDIGFFQQTLFLNFADTNHQQIATENGAIIVASHSDDQFTHYHWTLQTADDTLLFEFDSATDSISDFKQLLSIERKGVYLVINRLLQTINETDSVIAENEYSAVWMRKDHCYQRISAFYAQIHTLPTGFIARSAVEYGKASRYFLLNDSLKAISFMDYYDFHEIVDLGFGIQIETDKGCMFVTYDFVPITDDNWDEFRLGKKGDLMAIKNETVDLKSGMKVKDGKVQFFKLPKK